jgi:hypothetical protein
MLLSRFEKVIGDVPEFVFGLLTKVLQNEYHD